MLPQDLYAPHPFLPFTCVLGQDFPKEAEKLRIVT